MSVCVCVSEVRGVGGGDLDVGVDRDCWVNPDTHAREEPVKT